ncbi:MAG: homocysteine S-methyltransferase family protein [Clostridia bacterium]
MNKKEFREYLQNNIMILDGATGTQLQKKGMPKGVCPEYWVLEHPDVIIEVQKEYIHAGSNAVYSCTFGGNRIKLDEFGLGDKVIEINRKLAQLSKKAAGDDALVAGDLAPTGQFVSPVGEIAFEDMIDIYKEQVQGLLEGGVDFFVIETMMDIQEARAAVLAVKESCDLPVCVSMTFNEGGRTLTGTDSVTALITLQSMGVDAVGCNCSAGPQQMLEIIREMSAVASIPLLAKPNAGLPKLVNGQTVFSMDADEFGTYTQGFIDLGVALIGGCCGTAPEYIKQIKRNASERGPILPKGGKIRAITSLRKTVYIQEDLPLVLIGKRINTTGEQLFQERLAEGRTDEVLDLAMDQVDEGAEIVSINGINEKKAMLQVVESICSMVHVPLCLNTSAPEVIGAALRIYPGRALINSNLSEKEEFESMLPIAAKYGAMFVLPSVADETSRENYKIIQEGYSKAQKYGYEKEDFIVEALALEDIDARG